MFGGVEGYLVFFYGVDVIFEGLFEIVGKIVGYSILYGGDGFVGFFFVVVKYIEIGLVIKVE